MAEFEIDRALLLETFSEEAAEIAAAMEEALIALGERPDDVELLQQLFRSAHTAKGSASTIGLDGTRGLAHDLEGVLARLRARELEAAPATVSLLLRGVDALRATVTAEIAGASPPAEAEAVRGELRAVAASLPSPAAAPAAPGPGAQAGRADAARTLRVDVAKLDRMLDVVGEIAVARGRLADLLERGSAPEALEAHREADRLYLDLQDLVMRARMVPIGPTFRQQLRSLRDVAEASGKEARLVLEGEDVEVDTAVVEGVRDPLLHMVRNAVDHGIEAPDERRARGKDPCGRVRLRARHEGGSVVVEVSDDGAGLDRATLLDRARDLGLEERADDDAAVDQLVFVPGLSTRGAVTEISGRGVGMDVVRRNVEALRGTVHLRSERGAGTTFTIRLPLTLATIQGFRVAVADQTWVVPLEAVVECLELPRGLAAGSAGVLDVRGAPLPWLRLRDHFAVAEAGGPPPARESALVVQHDGRRVALVVDALLGESQTVLKPLARLFRRVPGVCASAIQGNGRVALVLDVAGLLADALRRAAHADHSDELSNTEGT